MSLAMNPDAPNHTHTCHSVMSDVRCMLKYIDTHSSSIAILGLRIRYKRYMRTIYDFTTCSVLMSGSIQTCCSLTRVYVYWLTSHVLWPVKHCHHTIDKLVLVYYHSYDSNWLGMFRKLFLYAPRSYCPNHTFDNLRGTHFQGWSYLIHSCIVIKKDKMSMF